MEAMTAAGEKVSAGRTMEPPCVRMARTPRTSPKQWKRGGGQQRIEEEVNARRNPIEVALFIKLLQDHDQLPHSCFHD